MRTWGLFGLLAVAVWAQTLSVGELFGRRAELDGKAVTVSGTFHVSKKIGSKSFSNVVEADNLQK